MINHCSCIIHIGIYKDLCEINPLVVGVITIGNTQQNALRSIFKLISSRKQTDKLTLRENIFSTNTSCRRQQNRTGRQTIQR